MTHEPQDSKEGRDAVARDAVAARDAGLRRVGHTTRWIAAGATALTGAFAGVAWQVAPGTASTPAKSATAQRSTASGRASVQQDNGAFDFSQGLAPPAQAPQSAGGSPPAAASGAS